METSKKILLATIIFGLGAIIYFLNRKARLSILSINWKDQTGTYKFGDITREFSSEMGEVFNDRHYIKDQFHLNGGKNYAKNRFLNVTNSLDRQKTIFEIEDENGNILGKRTIDWFTRLKY